MAWTKDDVQKVLRHPNTRKIDFWVGHFHVSYAGYHKVDKAIEDGRITVTPGDREDMAFYNPVDNVFLSLKSDAFTVTEQALVLHECTHALVDLRHAWKFTSLSDEAAAYLAQVTFRLLANPDEHFMSWDTQEKVLFRYMYWLVREYQLHKPEGRGKHLKWGDYERLRKLIQQHPDYAEIGWKERVFADGV